MIFRLRNLRQEQNLSAKELALKLNCSQSLIYEWEKGRCEPNIGALILLSDIFNCSVDYLLGREDDFGIIESKNNLLNENENQLIGLFRKLNERDQNKVLGYVQALAY